MNIHHLNCGTFCPVGRRMINGEGGVFEAGQLVCHCQLVETNGGLVLVDTGLGTADVHDPIHSLPGRIWWTLNRPQLRDEETAVHQVRMLGFNPEDVRHIVLTHLDFDHAGGLVDFPHAKVHIFADEFEEAFNRDHPRSRMRYAPRQFDHHPDFHIYQTQGDKWFGFDAVRSLDGVGPEVLLIPLTGHSRGHCGVAIQTENGWLLNAGDAFFHHREIEDPRRHCPLGLRLYQNIFQWNHAERIRNQRRLRELVHSNQPVEVFCSHDPEMMHRFAGHRHAAATV